MFLRITLILLILFSFGCGSGSKSSNSITPSPSPDKAGPPVTKEQNLISASKNGNIDKVRDSLENGVDIDYVDDDGRTALMYASQNGHINIVRLLIEQNADVNYQDDDGNTPLLSYSDDFADAGLRLLNLSRQMGFSNQVYQIIGEAFVKRGLMRKSGN